MSCKFFEMLEKRWAAGARVCVGLDSDLRKLPEHLRYSRVDCPQVRAFNHGIIHSTLEYALCYKFNIAFYSGRFRREMSEILKNSVVYIRRLDPTIPIIIDAKRADIGNTNQDYVEEVFENFDGDAVTVNPYFGMEAMRPFLDRGDKGIIVLCRTSNLGSGEFQDRRVLLTDNEAELLHTPRGTAAPLYQIVANRVACDWNYNKNCALVVGATFPSELKNVRDIVGNMWILVPGIGTQGGSLKEVIHNGYCEPHGGLIINSSSGIIFASGGEDFAKVTGHEAKKLNDQIRTLTT